MLLLGAVLLLLISDLCLGKPQMYNVNYPAVSHANSPRSQYGWNQNLVGYSGYTGYPQQNRYQNYGGYQGYGGYPGYGTQYPGQFQQQVQRYGQIPHWSELKNYLYPVLKKGLKYYSPNLYYYLSSFGKTVKNGGYEAAKAAALGWLLGR